MADAEERLSPAQAYERDELHRAFRRMLATVDGKRVLYWMLEQCSIYQDAWALESNVTNYSLGRQSVGRVVIGKLDEIEPRLYPQLLMDIAGIREVDRAAVESLTKKQENDDDLEG